jgi:hypothetical protein
MAEYILSPTILRLRNQACTRHVCRKVMSYCKLGVPAASAGQLLGTRTSSVLCRGKQIATHSQHAQLHRRLPLHSSQDFSVGAHQLECGQGLLLYGTAVLLVDHRMMHWLWHIRPH